MVSQAAPAVTLSSRCSTSRILALRSPEGRAREAAAGAARLQLTRSTTRSSTFRPRLASCHGTGPARAPRLGPARWSIQASVHTTLRCPLCHHPGRSVVSQHVRPWRGQVRTGTGSCTKISRARASRQPGNRGKTRANGKICTGLSKKNIHPSSMQHRPGVPCIVLAFQTRVRGRCSESRPRRGPDRVGLRPHAVSASKPGRRGWGASTGPGSWFPDMPEAQGIRDPAFCRRRARLGTGCRPPRSHPARARTRSPRRTPPVLLPRRDSRNKSGNSQNPRHPPRHAGVQRSSSWDGLCWAWVVGLWAPKPDRGPAMGSPPAAGTRQTVVVQSVPPCHTYQTRVDGRCGRGS